MRISMFGHKCIPSRSGGVEIVVGELGARMAALGHDVVCYNRSGADAKRDTYQNVHLKMVPTIDKKGLAAVSSSFFSAAAVAFSDADVCHIHAEGPALMSFLPKLFGKRVIVTVHGLDWQREKWRSGLGEKYIRWGEKFAVRFADEIIVLSKNMQDYFLQQYGRKTHYIPNGVTRPEKRLPEQIATQFGLQRDGYILFLGRLVPEKGVHYLIEAFAKVKTDKRLVIAGDSSDTDEYVKKLKTRSAQDERIIFTGFVEGPVLEELYSNAYLFVLPSDLEGMSLSLLEAMSYGNCCVVSDIAECTEVTENYAITFTKGDVQSLRAILQTLCDAPKTVEHYRKITSDFICPKYNWDDVTEKTLELYQ